MIRKLQRKIVWMTMGVLCLMILLINGVAHLSVLHVYGQFTQEMLRNLAESSEGIESTSVIRLEDGPLLGTLMLDKEKFFTQLRLPIYGLELAEDGQVRAFLDYRNEAVDAETLQNVISELAQCPAGGGKAAGYHYYKAEKDYGYYVAIADSRQGMEQMISRHLPVALLVTSVPVLLLMLVVSVILSRYVTAPAATAFARQKQFVSDAGHELKTPLSAISVNAAVLEAEIGPSRHMDCIRSEAQRMEGLIHQLLDVACLEGEAAEGEKEAFSLSEVVYQATLPYESAAFEHNIRYDVQIQENCQYTGDPGRIRQLVAILLDNAFKYGQENGEVSVRLRREGRRTILEVYNTGRGISKEDLPHVFERFYRCDRARPGNGSYGLGLAIAQAVVQGCGGSITAESEQGAWARFRVTL